MIPFSSTERNSSGQSNSDVETNIVHTSSASHSTDAKEDKGVSEKRWAPRDWELNTGKARPFSGLFINNCSTSTSTFQENEITTTGAVEGGASTDRSNPIAGKVTPELAANRVELSIPTAEEALAEARQMLEEADNDGDNDQGHGNVGIQWDDPPDFKPVGPHRDASFNPSLPTAEEALAHARKMLDDADGNAGLQSDSQPDVPSTSMGGEGNVGVQWDDPPPPPSRHDNAAATRIQRSGEGNVGLQWDDPPPPLTQDLSTSSRGQPSIQIDSMASLSHARATMQQLANGKGNVGVQWEDPPFPNAQQNLTASNPDVLFPGLDSGDLDSTENTTFGLPPSVDVDGEQGDVGMLMGSREGEVPHGMEWDPVGEVFKKKDGAEDRSEVAGASDAGGMETDGVRETGLSPREVDAKVVKEEEVTYKPASVRRAKSEGSGKEKGLIDRIRRRLSRAK